VGGLQGDTSNLSLDKINFQKTIRDFAKLRELLFLQAGFLFSFVLLIAALKSQV